MRAVLSVAVLALLPGCTLFQDAVDVFEGMTNPLVTLGVILSVEPGDQVDLSGAEVQEGTTATIGLADAAEVSDIEQAPVTGADVTVHGVAATDLGEGLYAVEPGPLTYDPGATWDVEVAIGSGVAAASVDLPVATTYTPPAQHTTGQGLTIDLSGQGYDSALVVVLDGQEGEVTWSNEPRTAREIYDFTHRSEETLVVQVPGSEAFPTDSVYFVGVAGMIHTGASDLTEMNTILSTLMAGKMVVNPVSTVPTQ